MPDPADGLLSPPMPASNLPASNLPAFDLAEFAGRISQMLHRAGVPVTAERAVRFVEILHLMPPVDRTTLYWAARLAFLTGPEQVTAFDAVFDRLFPGSVHPADGRGHRPPRPLAAVEPARRRRPPTIPPGPAIPGALPAPAGARPGHASRQPESDRDQEAIPAVASREEALGSKDFAALEEHELSEVRRLLAALVVATPRRRLRRCQPRHDGRHIDMRRTLRRSQRTGGDPARLARSRPTTEPRPLVLLCDISGSMEPYTRAYLHFFHAAAKGVHAEAFVFATRLTRLTTLLRGSSPEAALMKAGQVAPDWSGGTRIGQSLAEFNNRFGRRGMARGAVVVIFSDGWERDDPATVGREMARLRRLAYRVVWVNPRKAAPGFVPQAAGMAAALPFCDAFVSGHSVAALVEVIAAIADCHQWEVKAL